MKLIRTDKNYNGVFGILQDSDGNNLAVTLEHSYDGIPKIPNGTFTCVRGSHRLHGMTNDFITFEITGVPDHINILFHWGNYNKDSEGCVLLGKARVGDTITMSRLTFESFMDSLVGINSFQLEVT